MHWYQAKVKMVRAEGLEPSRFEPSASKADAFANFATPGQGFVVFARHRGGWQSPSCGPTQGQRRSQVGLIQGERVSQLRRSHFRSLPFLGFQAGIKPQPDSVAAPQHTDLDPSYGYDPQRPTDEACYELSLVARPATPIFSLHPQRQTIELETRPRVFRCEARSILVLVRAQVDFQVDVLRLLHCRSQRWSVVQSLVSEKYEQATLLTQLPIPAIFGVAP